MLNVGHLARRTEFSVSISQRLTIEYTLAVCLDLSLPVETSKQKALAYRPFSCTVRLNLEAFFARFDDAHTPT